MARNIDIAAAQAFYPKLVEALNKVPPYTHEAHELDKPAREKALADLRLLIGENGGGARERYDGTDIRLFGIRASSTSGLTAACRNWISQLTIKSAMARLAGGQE